MVVEVVAEAVTAAEYANRRKLASVCGGHCPQALEHDVCVDLGQACALRLQPMQGSPNVRALEEFIAARREVHGRRHLALVEPSASGSLARIQVGDVFLQELALGHRELDNEISWHVCEDVGRVHSAPICGAPACVVNEIAQTCTSRQCGRRVRLRSFASRLWLRVSRQ